MAYIEGDGSVYFIGMSMILPNVPHVIFPIKLDDDNFQSACERLFNIYQSLHYLYHVSLSIIQRHIYTAEQLDHVIDDIIEHTEVDELEYPTQTISELEDSVRHDLHLVITELIRFYETCFPYFLSYLRFLASRKHFLDVLDWSLDRNDVMVGLVTPRYKHLTFTEL